MGRRWLSLVIIVLAFLLAGCITDYTPSVSTVELAPGESLNFSAKTDDSTAELVWYLDGAQVAYDTTLYVFTAEGLSGKETAEHTLIVREVGGRYERYHRFVGLPAGYTQSVTWTIRVVPESQAVCFLDEDGDGYGDLNKIVESGNPPANCVNNGDDCNDADAAIHPEADERCDNVDNDCNGSIDDGYLVDIPNTLLPVNCGVGACYNEGRNVCINGAWVEECVPLPPSEEVCDGLDNDCDGTVDEIAPVPTTCGTGACARNGELACVGGAMVDSCVPGTPSTEICGDDLDNNCDGTVDDGCDCVPGATQTQTCGVGACEVNIVVACEDGHFPDRCVPGTPVPEVCDGIDNNCNGSVDDGIVEVSTTCGQGACAGNTGIKACIDGIMVDSCDPVAGATPEICDRLDNDCDGTVNDGLDCDCMPGDTIDYTCGEGACRVSVSVACADGKFPAPEEACIPSAPTEEVCDGIDNDCNGLIDDGIPTETTSCGTGACARTGELACVGGALVDSCKEGAPVPEVCDGLDNDCNGSADDGIAPVASSCGAGECARTGELTCISGALVDSCQAGTPVPEVCDGLDNDCNGSADDGIAPVATNCGTGECARTGESACIGGAIVDSCKEGTPVPEVCDGLDNDCNGSADDGIAPVATNCGTGECARTGELACVGGAMVDSCKEGTPAPEVCDGLDNDCNALIDDGFVEETTACGIGQCSRAGVLACIDGAVIDTCVPGSSAVEICDGLDNDCNGTPDDGIAQTPTTCGVGQCGNTGVLACVGGEMVDSCIPGPPSAEVCDSLDNNCDGVVDEGVCAVEVPDPPLDVAASDIDTGLTDVEVTWSASTGATYYRVYRAVWEEGSEYKLVSGEIDSTSFTFIQDWQTDVLDVVGPFPDTTIGEPTTVIAGMEIYHEKAVPEIFNFKAPAFFAVRACNSAGCSALSEPDAGQAEFIHTAGYSEVANLVVPMWLYPVIKTIGTVPAGKDAANWCGADICGPDGGMTMARLNQAGLQFQLDIYLENYIDSWGLHPTSEFWINGYIGGDHSLLSFDGIRVSGVSAFSYGTVEAEMDVYLFVPRQYDLSAGYIRLTYKDDTYLFTMPIEILSGMTSLIDFRSKPLTEIPESLAVSVSRRNTPYPTPFYINPLSTDICPNWTDDLIQDCDRIEDPKPVP